MRYSSKALPNAVLEKMSPADRPAGKAGMTAAECQDKIDLKSERELQKQCANYLRQRDIWFAQSKFGKKTTNAVGTPDFLLALNGKPVAFECKFEKGKLTPEQALTFHKMMVNGWQCFVVRSLNELMAIIQFGEGQ